MMSSFAPEVIFHLGSFPVTNTFLNTILVDFIILGFALVASRKITLVPGFVQNFTEYIIESFYNLTESIAGKRTDMIFPFFITFFLFIMIANFTNLIPGINTFGIREHGELIPFLRGTTSDLNTTLALALISMVATHYLSIKTLGIKEYLGRFVPIPKNPMGIILLFVGFLEIISEFTKVISLSFRLFGNIYAGEIVLHTISSIFAFIAPLPFLLLEVIVGFVQALVFSMLTLVFMVILTTPHHEEEAKEVNHV